MHASPGPETRPGAASIPRLARGLRLQWEAVPQAWVLLFPEGRVTLNGSAAEIMRRVDGQRSIGAITQDLQLSFNELDLAADVLAAFELAQQQGWVLLTPGPAHAADGPQTMRDPGADRVD